MKRWLFIPLLLLVCTACMSPAFAAPGDLVAAHAQQFVAADSGDAITAALAPIVTAVAPLLPAPWGGMALALMPLIGILTNIWWRWRNKDIALADAKKANLLLIQALAYAEELSAAAKKVNAPLSPVETMQQAVNYVQDLDTGKRKLFAGVGEIEKKLTSLLGRIPGVGATGDQVV